MRQMDFCQLWLTCKDTVEADKIAAFLLDKRLIACAKKVPAKSKYHWQGKIEQSSEVILVMDSKTESFDEIEAEVTKLHSYDTFVLQAVPIVKISKEAEKWLENTC